MAKNWIWEWCYLNDNCRILSGFLPVSYHTTDLHHLTFFLLAPGSTKARDSTKCTDQSHFVRYTSGVVHTVRTPWAPHCYFLTLPTGMPGLHSVLFLSAWSTHSAASHHRSEMVCPNICVRMHYLISVMWKWKWCNEAFMADKHRQNSFMREHRSNGWPSQSVFCIYIRSCPAWLI